MASILVLGASGMLGSMVLDYLSGTKQHIISATTRTHVDPEMIARYPQVSWHLFDAQLSSEESIAALLARVQPEYVINCIGIIKPYCKDNDPHGVLRAIRVNALFPHELAAAATKCGARVLQIATDCAWSGTTGDYLPTTPHDALDVYGKTKSLGEVESSAVVHIRSSIIGPELKGKVSLMEWVLTQPDGGEINGFTHHQWNGVTTLQLAELFDRIVSGKIPFDALRSQSAVHHFMPNQALNKHELVSAIVAVFGKPLTVKPTNAIGLPIDRTIGGASTLLHDGNESSTKLQDALIALRAYMQSRPLYSERIHMNKPLISIIVVNYNGKDALLKLFTSIFAQTYQPIEVICVDNGSRDGSSAYLREHFSQLIVIDYENRGYGTACNRGAERATGEYVVFLNHDMWIPERYIEDLYTTYQIIRATDSAIGALACTEDAYDMSPRADVVPGKIDIFGYQAPNAKKSRKGAFIPGCPFFMPRALFMEVGQFCESIFLYGEDTDLSWRLTLMGKHNYAAPEIRLYHAEGATMNGFPPRKINYLVHGSLVSVFNNYSLPFLLVMLPLSLLFSGVVISSGLVVFTRNWQYPLEVWRGIWSFLRKIPQMMPFRRAAQARRQISDWQFAREHIMLGSSFLVNKSYRRL